MRPNFFLVGAPKCGTTSLASWLAGHERIFFSSPKEPHFFNVDYHSPGRPRSMEAYERLFEGVSENHLAVGEGSTGYLRSKVAIPSILEYAPGARFIVCLRNPIEMVPSVHAQLLKTGKETVRSPEQAWDLQYERSKGRSLPALCHDPKLLQYHLTCALGSQLDQLTRLVSRRRILCLLLEDMQVDARAEYLKTLEFLHVPDDGRKEFSALNVRRVPRSVAISRLVWFGGMVKASIGLRRGFGIARRLEKANAVRSAPVEVSEQFRDKLQKHFEPEIKLLGELLDRDLSHWLNT